MVTFLNGRFVPAEEATVSVFDRSFLYGDGLFETLRVCHGRPFRWAQHLERLQRGADFLGIRLPYANDQLLGFSRELIRRNEMPDALLRLTVSRGVGPRGYSPKGADQPTVLMSLHDAPVWNSPLLPCWKLVTSSVRLPVGDPLTQYKTCNKLTQILARGEAEARGADEALLLNTEGYAVETTSGNLFWIDGGGVCTPPAASGILPGVTRSVLLELCRAIGIPVQGLSPQPRDLLRASGVFVTLSSLGVVAAGELDGTLLPASELTGDLARRYAALLDAETRAGSW